MHIYFFCAVIIDAVAKTVDKYGREVYYIRQGKCYPIDGWPNV